MFVRAAAISLLALLAVAQTSGQAAAEHGVRLKMLWPKIYAPRISGHIYRDRYETEDEGFFDWEDEEVFIPRRRKNRDIVLELYEDDFEPIYEPPRKKKAVKTKPKAKAATVNKAPAKSTKTVAKIAKPTAKPTLKSAATVPSKATTTAVTVATPKPQTVAQKSTTTNTTIAQKVAPKTSAPSPTPTKVQLAAVAPAAAGTIGCSKGAEIVSGYGFTSVKPRSCTGGTYSFAATRAASAYVIKVAAATGEITDVQKLK